MPRQGDIEQVDAVARESAMTRGERVAFGGLLEAAKADGGGGTRNGRGDFTIAELRAEAQGRPSSAAAVAVDLAIGRGASARDAERHVGALVGSKVLAVRLAYDDALTVRFAVSRVQTREGTLRLAAATWLVRRDGRDVARSGDARDHALGQLRALRGAELTQAGLRRHDGALALSFDADPFAESLALIVRGPRGRRAASASWELATPDGLLVTAGGGGSIRVRPDALWSRNG